MGFAISQWNSCLYLKHGMNSKYLSTLGVLLDALCSHLTPTYQPSIPHYHVIRTRVD